jgi:hypothetical protein
MGNIHKMKLLKFVFCMILVLALANTALWILSSSGRVDRPSSDDSKQINIVTLERDRGQYGILGDIDSGMLSGLPSPSLEMKENVDFFLTPALLVQECISEDVIITYPGE